jgi:hypothetical protein
MIVGPLFAMRGPTRRTFPSRSGKEHRFKGRFNVEKWFVESYGCYVWCKGNALRRRRLKRKGPS